MSTVRYHLTIWARRVAPLVLVFGFAWVLAPSPASAILGVDCKDSPVPEAPGGGIAGFLGQVPDKVPSDAGGTFVGGAPSVEHYGTAGFTFHTYDLGCGPDATRDPGAVIGTTVGNWMLEGVKAGVTLASSLLDVAYHPTYLSVFDPLLGNATGSLQTAVFDKYVPITILVVGMSLLLLARKGSMSSALTVAGWALMVMVIATAVFRWPVQAGHAADDSMTQVLGSINSGINGGSNGTDPVVDAQQALVNSVLWEEWKAGNFGRADSPTADKYAEDLFKATTLTWAEAQAVRDGDDSIIDQKKKDYEQVADEIKKADPDAYQYLTGKSSSGRFGAVLTSIFALACVAPFVIAGSLMLIGAYLLIRMAVVFFPLIATFGVAYQFRGAVRGVGTVVMAAVINSVMFGAAVSLTLLAMRIVLNPKTALPLWLALVLMAVLTFLMWAATKPIRSLTQMASPNRNVFGDAAGSFGRTNDAIKGATLSALKTAAGAAVGGAAGAAVATQLNEKAEGEQLDDSHNRRPRTEGYAAPAQPAPQQPVALGAASTPEPTGLPAGAPPAAAPLPLGYSGKHAGEPDPAEDDVTVNAPGDVEHPALPAAPATATTPPTEREIVEGEVFIPGDAPESAPEVPDLTEPRIDENGEQVYDLFRPDEAQAGGDR